MSKQRADLGFADELENFDPASFSPSPRSAPPQRPAATVTRQVAEATGFQSREAKTSGAGQGAPLVRERRRRTGRNMQFNIKAKPETIEAFCAVADAQGWGLGETLEYAVELLQQEYGKDVPEGEK